MIALRSDNVEFDISVKFPNVTPAVVAPVFVIWHIDLTNNPCLVSNLLIEFVVNLLN